METWNFTFPTSAAKRKIVVLDLIAFCKSIKTEFNRHYKKLTSPNKYLKKLPIQIVKLIAVSLLFITLSNLTVDILYLRKCDSFISPGRTRCTTYMCVYAHDNLHTLKIYTAFMQTKITRMWSTKRWELELMPLVAQSYRLPKINGLVF